MSSAVMTGESRVETDADTGHGAVIPSHIFTLKTLKYVNCDISDKLDMRHRLELVSTCDVRFEESGL